MNKPISVIEVSYQRQHVGRLALTPDRFCAFEYSREWISNGFSLSPFHLPLKPGVMLARPTPFNGLFGVFNDSLPDGWGRLLMDRWLMSQNIDPNALSVLDRLSLVGKEGMGALSYTPSQCPGIEATSHPLRHYARQVEQLLGEEDAGSYNTGLLEELLKLAGSSGGARPKVLVKIDGEEWLVKFRATVDPHNVGELEYHHSLLAKKAGILMPETTLFEGKYFGTHRFDRQGETRIHVHSAAGLLYASHRMPSLDYTELMKATMALTRDINEVARMFRLMVFNVLIGNKDDHAKNFSFIYDNNSWKLSPAYDLLPSSGFGGQHTTTVNGNGNPTLTDCLEVARITGFPVKRANEIIGEVEEGLRP
ncbi:MAG: type II toxin-antitoxin system HipA family toxin [Bacteroidales bacterium]|nr:type II toxin-antitoxin system HipA family toxin [Bacteroidales bacterium]